jgi:CelD/BcsL family acetyltransferase involved in cellulose biosynthesis
LQFEIISEAERLRHFAPEWSALVEAQPHATPFQLPDWLMTWWSHFGSGSLRVFVFRNHDCVGVLPCFLHDWNGARQITLVGSGVSDYLDPPLAASHKCAVLSCLREQLAATCDWDVCDWQDLSYDTALEALAGGPITLQKREEVPGVEVRLSGKFETFWEERPRYLRRNTRRSGEKARPCGPLTFRMTAEPDPNLIHALVRLHTARWNATGKPGMIEANHTKAFLFDVTRQFAHTDMLRFFTLYYRGDVVAIILAFVYRRIVYEYLTGSDPAYKQFSFGSVLLYEAIRACYAQGFCAWNFCRGDEPYKADWGGQAIRRCRIVLQRKRS